MKRKVIVAALLGVIVSSVASLAFFYHLTQNRLSLRDTIVGHWQEDGRSCVMEFFKNGTVKNSCKNDSSVILFQYKILDNETLQVSLPGIEFWAMVYKVRIADGGSVLIFANQDGNVRATVRRVSHK